MSNIVKIKYQEVKEIVKEAFSYLHTQKPHANYDLLIFQNGKVQGFGPYVGNREKIYKDEKEIVGVIKILNTNFDFVKLDDMKSLEDFQEWHALMTLLYLKKYIDEKNILTTSFIIEFE